MRSKYSRHMASLATFIASGLFHEWLLSGKMKTIFKTQKFNLLCSVNHMFCQSLLNIKLIASLTKVVFQPDREDDVCDQIRCYIPGYGRNTLFFVWNALVVRCPCTVQSPLFNHISALVVDFSNADWHGICNWWIVNIQIYSCPSAIDHC